MFELLVLVVPSDKKDLYLFFINKHIFPKLVRGPLFLSTTFSHGHSWSFTIKHALYPTDRTFEEKRLWHRYFCFSPSAYTIIICETTYNMQWSVSFIECEQRKVRLNIRGFDKRKLKTKNIFCGSLWYKPAAGQDLSPLAVFNLVRKTSVNWKTFCSVVA